MLQTRPLVEGVERQFLNERYPIHLDVVVLRAELHLLHLLAPDDGHHVRIGHAQYPVGNAFPRVAALEVIALLAVHLRDNVHRPPLLVGQPPASACSRSIFRSEVQLRPSFWDSPLAHQTEILRHLAQREELLHPSRFRTLE